MFDETFRYNDWANGKMMSLSQGLSDAQLDAPKAMGFGSLRATLFHILVGEELWQDRFDGKPWAPLELDPRRIDLDQIAGRMHQVGDRRKQLLSRDRATGFERIVEYTNTEGNTYRHRLADLLTHLANHSIHHRAQALNMLRGCERRVPGGLDYLFYKLAHPSIRQAPAAIERVRAMGLDADLTLIDAGSFDVELSRRYAHYGAWAIDQLFRIADQAPASAWNQQFEIGSGSVRSTLCHIVDAERWWLRNLLAGASEYQALPDDMSCADAWSAWKDMAIRREAWMRQQTDESLGDVVECMVGGVVLRFHVGEALLQLCGHGTHHRAQVVNMLRQIGRPAPPLDFVVWLRQGTPIPHPL